jgi:hypothetical protein
MVLKERLGKREKKGEVMTRFCYTLKNLDPKKVSPKNNSPTP